VHATPASATREADSCLTREILHRIGDKWPVFVIDALAGRTRRFSDLAQAGRRSPTARAQISVSVAAAVSGS
jgi:DNA-binding HxlR family transcriptional regulator